MRGVARPGSFYDGRPGRELVRCPSCRLAADPVIGDHGDDRRCAELRREHLAVAAELAAARRPGWRR